MHAAAAIAAKNEKRHEAGQSPSFGEGRRPTWAGNAQQAAGFVLAARMGIGIGNGVEHAFDVGKKAFALRCQCQFAGGTMQQAGAKATFKGRYVAADIRLARAKFARHRRKTPRFDAADGGIRTEVRY